MSEVDDDPITGEGGEDAEDVPEQETTITKSFKPACAGLSFSVSNQGADASVLVDITCGIYMPKWVDESGMAHEEKPHNIRTDIHWHRAPISISLEVPLDGIKEIDLTDHGLPHLVLFIKTSNHGEKKTATLQAYNSHHFEDGTPYYEKEKATFLQFKITVRPTTKTLLVPRPIAGHLSDEDARISALIYRNIKEYAVGHTCAADWKVGKDYFAEYVATEWLPQQQVLGMDTAGDGVFSKTFTEAGIEFPSAEFLATAEKNPALKSLEVLVNAYEGWLAVEEKKINDFTEKTQIEQAKKNIETARSGAILRMREGIKLLEKDAIVYEAFRLANSAMQLQYSWRTSKTLEWRPFQLAFVLMSLSSLAQRDNKERRLMDLIWFPTGGGKTEAYLLLTAFILFYRRMKATDKQTAYGVAAFMRYTLRTLTVQQFERATALIAACEYLRKSNVDLIKKLGAKRFSIGLWVGSDSTPNNFEKAKIALEGNLDVTPAQVKKCPACRSTLKWECNEAKQSIVVTCEKDNCLGEIPILTVDTQIYAELPSLIIGTVDKFAQIVRKEQAVHLFGLGTPHDPPDLIIQDELHLISGPLGTMVGLYETAVDKFCSLKGSIPKIIGSTATIRRAREQVNHLFHRDTYQFPPPIIDAENSCFAKVDSKSPGRIYMGITTAGRSQKFSLQAVASSLLQGFEDPLLEGRANNFSTLVAYFNSLRILGGALVVMQDDVDKGMRAYASRRREKKRTLSIPEEMTSRKKSREIPEILARLELEKGDPDFIDILLATNMLSVGVDIARLGLMLVTGQPKTMSEYIQATSRVGRQMVPGLVVTTYNDNKIRDRVHYENFKTWHQSLYRELEGSSVTPFAARARDKALHAVLIVLARHLVPELKNNPRLNASSRAKIEKEIVPYITSRIEALDHRELEDAALQMERILDDWEDRYRFKVLLGKI